MAGTLSGQAASVRCTGAVPPLILVGLGVMAPVLDGVAVRARRRQRARSAPSGSRRGWQRALGVDGHAAASGGLGGAVYAAPLSSGRKAAAAVAHGEAHHLLLVADARKAPGVRAVQGQESGDEEQGDAVALARSTSSSEENDSSH